MSPAARGRFAVSWSAGLQIGWIANRLVGKSAGRQIGWSADRLVGRSARRQIGWIEMGSSKVMQIRRRSLSVGKWDGA
ncbi:MAG: hypothetical protein K0U36_00040 [Alphaproteobacteria bacterium]|nr:hypothetical protein [Alphaproteobacteria bacterium]